MQDSESRQIDRSQRVDVFTAANAAAFPAGSRGAELIVEHNALSIEIEQHAAKQAAATLDWQEQTEQRMRLSNHCWS
ncbi:MAG: hypothetical protein QOF02_1298 [Blastocatellia bacterium]|nr:hypothetical protein [Blastocatellia bacterium]